MKLPIILFLAALFVGGCATPVSVDQLKTSKKVVIVAALEPVLFGQKAGIGDFIANAIVSQVALSGLNIGVSIAASEAFRGLGNDAWRVPATDFDVNGVILNVVKENLNIEPNLVDGVSVGLAGGKIALGIKHSEEEELELTKKIEALGRERNADFVVIIHSTIVSEWMQNSGRPVYGVGHFDSHFNGLYCVLVASVFDCKTGRLGSAAVVKHARKPIDLAWHKAWEDYSPDEKRMVLRGLDIVVKEAVPVLVAQLGLAKEGVQPLPVDHSFGGQERPKSFIPDGNEFDIPSWASVRQAHEAVLAAFKRHDWTIKSDSDNQIVGMHPKGSSREAVCTVTISGRKIAMVPTAFEILDDGNRKPIEHFKGWHENLKVAVMGSLMKAPQEEVP